MNIPPNSNILSLDKRYAYALDAVYFVRDSNYFTFSIHNGHPSPFGVYDRNRDSVFNIFLTYCTGVRGPCKASGYVVNLAPNTISKFTENQGYHQRYLEYLAAVATPGADQYGWVVNSTAINTSHEIGHLLGLKHTVLENNGSPCPTN